MPAVTHSNTPFAANVFVNGGPTLGGGVADALGLDDTIGISEAQSRAMIAGRAAELAAGNDPDTKEALEQYGGGKKNGMSPITGTEGSTAAPGSDAAIGADALVDANIPRPTSAVISVLPTVNPRVTTACWSNLETMAKDLAVTLTINSAYRTTAYNKSVGGAKSSLHVERKAVDVQWGTTNAQGRVNMIQAAIDAGFTGIGCYEDFIHLDVGDKRHWGPNGSFTGQFAQYKLIVSANGYTVE